jgi:hypothetical protein
VTIFLISASGYLLVMLVLAMRETDWKLDELVVLCTWPVSIPLGEVWRRWNYARRTCPVCKHRWRYREQMLAHRAIAHPVGSVQGSGE